MEKIFTSVAKLAHLPWTSCDIEGQKYIMKCIFHETSYTILLSDLKRIYYEEINEASLNHRSKEMNSSVEILPQRVIEQLCLATKNFTAGSNVAGTRLSILEKDSNHIILKSESLLSGIPFMWHFNLETMDSDMNYNYLTCPLLSMVSELQRRNNELIKIIKQKDEEIDNYKTTYSQLALKKEEFSESEFLHKMDDSMNVVDNFDQSVSSTFQDQLFLKVASAFQNSLGIVVKMEETPSEESCIEKSNSQNASSTMNDNVNLEEITRRQLLQQQHDFKREKRAKKKRINF